MAAQAGAGWQATPTSVAPDPTSIHTPTMTLKNAALLALIGTILMIGILE
jgi:hypothetical protein